MYLVLNKARNEGVVFEDLADAKHAAGIKKVKQLYSSIADQFAEYYAEEEPLTVVEIDI